MFSSPLKVLLICDSAGDIRLIWELFKDSQIANCLDVIRNGETALAYLQGDCEYQGVTLPDLILVDIRLQFVDGFDIFGGIRANQSLHNIPLVALLGSDYERALLKDMQIETDHYLTMPLTIQSLVVVLRLIFNRPDRGLAAASGAQ
jgi:DNA-binding response OmpR family regulator